MGIRFYCPNGHKLNVKAFQAGRKGICPYCGAKIQIPTHSTRKSSRDEHHAGQRRGAHVGAGSQAAGFSPGPPHGGYGVIQPQPGGSAAVELPGHAPSSPAEKPGGYSSPDRTGAPPQGPPIEAAQPSQPVIPQQTDPAVSAPAPQRGAPGGHGSAGSHASAQAEGAQPAPPSSPRDSAPSVSVPRDPLREGAEVVWYVRPPSGGQFGPATPDVMRSWIDQGRVSPDSLVWREGWRDWQEAGEVFPQLGAGEQASPFRQFEQAPATPSQPGSPATQRVRSRRQSQTVQMVIVIVLVFAVMVLFGVFLWVLTRGDEAPPETVRAAEPTVASSLEPAARKWSPQANSGVL